MKIKFILLLLVLSLTIAAFTGIALIDHVAASLFLIYVIAAREWRLAWCGIIFSLLSMGRYVITAPILSDIPALWMLSMLILSMAIVSPLKKTRSWRSWAKWGRIDPRMMMAIIAIAIIAAVALLLWANWTDHFGMAIQMAEKTAAYPRYLVILMIPLFAILNSVAEESVYRGVLQTALFEGFQNHHLVILLQASAFAALHYASGFPNGAMGYAMVLGYGIMLGYLKIWSQGMLAPIITHMFADLTIFYFMIWLTDK